MKVVKNIRRDNNLSKYSWGGWVEDKLGIKENSFLGKAVNFGQDAVNLQIDNAGSQFGMENYIQEDAYNNKFMGKLSNITNKINKYGSQAAMNIVAPGSGAALGAVQEGVAGGVGDPMQDRKNAAKKQKINESLGAQQYSTNQGYPNVNINQNDLTRYAHGGISGYPNAELEKGEPFRTPDGKIYKVSDKAPTHAQGGVQLNLPEGTEILGKNKIMDKQFKELGSKLQRVQKQADKVMDEPSTALTRTTALRNMQNVQKQWDALMQMQEVQKTQQDMGMYRGGGKVTEFSKEENGNEQAYAYTMLPDSTKHEKYFYNSGDSAFEFEQKGNKRAARVYKAEDFVKGYSQNDSIPNDVLERTFKAIDKLKKYPDGGKVDPIQEFNKKYKTDYVSLGDFTKYNKGESTANEDYYKLLHMMSSQPNYEQLEKRANLAGIQADINSLQKVKSNPVQMPVYDEREELEKEAVKMYSKGGKLPKFEGGTPPWYKWMSETDPDQNLINQFAQSNATGLNGQSVSKDPNLIGNYWKDVRAGKNPYKADNKYGTGPSLFNFKSTFKPVDNTANATTNTGAQAPPLVRYNNGPTIPMEKRGIPSFVKKDGINPVSNPFAKNDLAPVTKNEFTNFKGEGFNSSKLGEYGMAAGIMAPALYNLGRGLFEKADTMNANDYRNRNEGEAMGIMKNMHYNYDIDPVLAEIRTGNNIGDYNAKNYSRSTGELLNRMQGNIGIRNKSVADAYTQKYNIENQANNQYKGQYANALLGQGAANSDIKYKTDIYNKQAKAAKADLVGTALSQGQQGIQQYMLMRNKNRNDQVMYSTMREAMSNYKDNPRYWGPIIERGMMAMGNVNTDERMFNVKGDYR